MTGPHVTALSRRKAWTPLIFSCRKRGSTDFYRPQRSCEGYVFTPVWLSTGGGGRGSASVHAGIPPPPPPGAGTPPREQAPHGSRHPQTGTPLEQTPPPPEQTPPWQMATDADYASYWNAFL